MFEVYMYLQQAHFTYCVQVRDDNGIRHIRIQVMIYANVTVASMADFRLYGHGASTLAFGTTTVHIVDKYSITGTL